MLPTVWNTWRGSQSYIEKRRGRDEIEVTRKRRGGVKRGESNLVSNQFPKCLHSLEHPKRFKSYTEKRRGRMEIEVTRRRREGVKRGETNLASSHTPK